MNENERYEFVGRKNLIIKEQLIKSGIHHVTLSSLPADFYKMSKSQMERLSEYACDNMIAEMYDLPKYEITKRRRDFGLDQMTLTSIKADREDKSVAIYNEILRIVSNEYNNGNIPHTNSTPLNSEKEFLYMKATGIVRRIDDLGRVVIPKEIRRTMRIREGDPLEIYTQADGEVIFKKYSPVGELGADTKQYVDVLARTTGLAAVICDRDRVVAAAGMPKKDIVGKRISPMLESYMERRSGFALGTDKDNIVVSEEMPREVAVMSPIIGAGDILGAVVLLCDEKKKTPGVVDVKLTQVAAGFMSKQMEE